MCRSPAAAASTATRGRRQSGLWMQAPAVNAILLQQQNAPLQCQHMAASSASGPMLRVPDNLPQPS